METKSYTDCFKLIPKATPLPVILATPPEVLDDLAALNEIVATLLEHISLVDPDSTVDQIGDGLIEIAYQRREIAGTYRQSASGVREMRDDSGGLTN
ncbi:hypothetical protein [Luteolibacter sp. Populi]|uniref:hypothetical protein n=1 Tax=Luteolibacter sp. Populi TaxID=3230487 RepID=UPI0034667A2E